MREESRGRAAPPGGARARLFHPGAPTADIGSGSGRDVAWFTAHGYPAVGFDASAAMRRELDPETARPGVVWTVILAEKAAPRAAASARTDDEGGTQAPPS